MGNIGSTGAVTGMEIAVIGMSGRFPGAMNIDEFWDNLIMRVESLSFFSDEEVEAAGVPPEVVRSPNYVKARMTLKDIEYFDSVFFNYTPREVELMEPQMRLFHECAWEALEDAGYDPESYKGNIGVISGASSSAYWEALSFFSGNTGWGDSMLANKDFISTRIAYKLNLTGPASMVQTACSTSLVGIHQACRALLTGECKMMMVGGVGMTLPQKQGYLYEEGMILAPDGHCRAFDANAGGTVGGNGIGVVLLKRLKNAIDDGDYIYAVIKSTAINNDGSQKVGYTAPRVEGQAAVISTALRMARVPADSICYVETHGTGTPLGDSIEIEALKKAFDTKRKAYCALGAVKTNIGHLDAAAGIAGFIKTILVLKHRLIPPNLNFETPNPTLNLIDSPFYVNTVCSKLEGDKMPLRAGVSSFGIGGTNVHAILEETPQRESPLPSREYHLLLFSALSEVALKMQVENFVDYLKKNLEVNLGDAAYTLQIGRRLFKYRRMAVCANTAEAILILSSPAGISFVNRGSLPYENEPELELFNNNEKGRELKTTLEKAGNLWLLGRTIDWSAFYRKEKRYRIPLPTYPFQRQRYWKDVVIGGTSLGISIMPTLQAVQTTHLPHTLTQEEWENIAHMEQELHEELKIKGISDYNGLETAVDRLCASYIFYFLEKCGIDTEKGRTYTLEKLKKQLKILPKYEKFFRFFIDVLVQDRFLAVNDNHIRFLTGKDQIRPPGKFKQEVQEKYPGFKGFFQLLEYCVNHYKEALSGGIEGVEVLFPGGKAAADMESFQIQVEYSNLRIYCLLLEKIIFKMIDKSLTSKKWRILEIGAGTGTLTKFLVPVLKKMNRDIEYHFTDIGNFFVTRAKNDPFFENVDFIRYGILDISRDPVLQGYPAGYFDMVLGFNVVHAVPYIKEALVNLEGLLVPGGTISLIETIRAYRWFNMIDGLAEGWWYFRDEEIRKESPLLNLDTWEEIFKTQGFNDVNTFPRDGARRLESDIGLIIAHRDANPPSSLGYERSHIRSPYTPPGNEWEEKLVGMYQEVLGMKKVGVLDDFFQLKVDSLIAISITARIHKEFAVRIPLPLFFEKATIRRVAEYIREAHQDVYSSLEPVEEKEYYPLSSSQRRLYVLQQLEPDTIGFNIPYAMTVEGEVELEKLSEAFKKLSTRHESFRTSFILIEDEPVQRIHRGKGFDIEYYECLEGQNPDSIVQGFVRPFEMSRGPLLRVGLIPLSPTAKTSNILMVDMHHIIADGTSLSIFIREFTALVEGQSLPIIKVQYKDYSEWQRRRRYSDSLEKQREFWLAEYEGEIPVCDFPTDYPRPPVQSYEGAAFTFDIDEKESRALNLLVQEEETTLFAILLALLNVFVYKMSGDEDIVIGTSVIGRRVVDIERTIGIFINTLALRNRLTGDLPFKNFLKSLGKKVLQAFENQEYPFADLVEKVVVSRDMSRNPLFDINFILQNMDDPEIEIQGLKLKTYPLEHRTAQIDLNIFAVERKGKIQFNLEYSTRLFKENTILRFTGYFKGIVQAVIRDRDLKVSQIDIMSDLERYRLLFEFNNTRHDFPRDKCYHSLFEASVLLHKDRVGVLHNGRYMSYAQINEASNRFAHFLLETGIQPSGIVCLYMERRISLLVSIIGTYKAGAAYLPVETDYPINRVRYMFKNSDAAVIVTEPAYLETIDGLKGELPCLKIVLCMDGEGCCSRLLQYPVHNPSREYSLENLAYLMYTSGTTGEPKGVMIQQKGMLNHMYAKMRYFTMTGQDVLPQTGPACFDISVWQLLAPILLGSFTFIIDTLLFLDPPVFLRILQRERVSILEFVPPWLTAFLEVIKYENNWSLDRMRYMVSTGDVLPVSLVRNWYREYPGIKIVNTYGPTEASDDIAHYTVDAFPQENQVTIPVGKPLDNLHIYVLDKDLNLCPVGVKGEICVSGLGVGKGYWKDEEKTAQSFVPNPFRGEIGDPYYTRMYKMGDIGYRREDGNVECLGRRDQQVKIKSHRIELGEIENLLLKHPLVKNAVVIARDSNGPHREKYLCTYVVPTDNLGSSMDISQLRDYLSRQLPSYMVPLYFIPMDSIPVTPNGKIHRKALPEPKSFNNMEVYTAPRNQVEVKLVEIWSQILEIEKEKISIDTDFFILGGNSFQATIMISKIHKASDVKISLANLFEIPNIRGLARLISRTVKTPVCSILSTEKKEYYALSSAQERVYLHQSMNPGALMYNIFMPVLLNEEPERERLGQAFRETIRRHESLRTWFYPLAGGLVQRIQPQVEFEIAFYKENYSIEEFLRPHDFTRAPLLRAAVWNQGEDNYLLMLDMHHIISDAVSIVLLGQELITRYTQPGEKLPPLALQYRDFAEWQAGNAHQDALKKQESCWLEKLGGELPILNLPTDFPRQTVPGVEGTSMDFKMAVELSLALKKMAQEENVTMYMLVLAIYTLLLSKFSGQEEILVGTLTAGRNFPGLEDIIGMFVNTIVLRLFPAGQKTFISFLKEVKGNTLEAFENQDFQLEKLLERVQPKIVPGHHTLFETMFAFQDIKMPGESSHKAGESVPVYQVHRRAREVSLFDISFVGEETGDGLIFTFEYSTKLFRSETIQRFYNYFEEIVHMVLEDRDIRLNEIDLSLDLLESKSENYQIDFGF